MNRSSYHFLTKTAPCVPVIAVMAMLGLAAGISSANAQSDDSTVVADAIADAVEPANMKPPPFAKRRAIIGVDPGTVEIKPLGDADRSASHVTGFADEIDDRARRVAGEGRGGTAAHHFDARNTIVWANEGVGGREGDIAKIQHRQAIFLKLNELAATACRRQTADRDVGVAFAA